jgi:hypothetical protein
MVAVTWLALQFATLGFVQSGLVMRTAFPGLFIHWPGLPWEGATGGMILVVSVVTTATNGVIYALIAVGISGLMEWFSADYRKPN